MVFCFGHWEFKLRQRFSLPISAAHCAVGAPTGTACDVTQNIVAQAIIILSAKTYPQAAI